MNYKKLVKVMNIWMAISMVLILTILILGKEYTINKTIITQQNNSILAYKIKLCEMQKNLSNFDLYKFKETVLTKKYPHFSKVSEIVYEKCKEMEIDPLLILGIIEIESSFKPNAVSNKGAYGLMQINYRIWKNELGIDFNKIFDIEYNVELGIRVLQRYLYHSNGNILKALHLYNNGFSYNNTSYKYKVIASDFLRNEKIVKQKTTL